MEFNNIVDNEILKMTTNRDNYVVQANDIITGRQNLSLNSCKLIRTAIMNVVKEDVELKDYQIGIRELAELFEVSVSDISKDSRKIVNDIIKNPLEIKQVKGNREKYIAIPWVKYIEYDSNNGFTLKLNDLLKPYLLNLKAHYTQYKLDNIVRLKSVYAIRLLELIERKHIGKKVPIDGYDVQIGCDEIREACACPKSYKTFGNLKLYVIDSALREINDTSKTIYYIEYSYIKKGKAVVAVNFHVNTKLHKKIIDNGLRMEVERKVAELNQKMEERKNG